jgi:hypothetical protein
MRHFHYLVSGVFLAVGCFVPVAGADTFGNGENSFEIKFVPIGSPGNPADTTGNPNPAGSVPYVYRIGKYEISEQMIDKANALGNLGITKDTRGPDKPATRVSWFEAATFVNWLNTSTGHTPAYKFDGDGEFQLWTPDDTGYDVNNLFRNSEAKYFLPSADEWYKAAFYDTASGAWYDFPNGSNTAPLPVASGTDPNTAVWNQGTGPADIFLAGGPSPFGTVGQAGNVIEWEETERDMLNDFPGGVRGARGGDFLLSITDQDLSSSFGNHELPFRETVNLGFRIVSIPIPEPTTAWIVVSGIGAIVTGRRTLRRLAKSW